MQADSESLAPEEPVYGYPSFEEAQLAALTQGIPETSDKLIDYFSVSGREAEVGSLFYSLNFPDQLQFIDSLLAEVFEGESGHNDPPTIEYRKRISNELRLMNNNIDLNRAVSDARIGKADTAIKYFRANPHRIKSFFSALNEYPEESKAVILTILEYLLGKIHKRVD